MHDHFSGTLPRVALLIAASLGLLVGCAPAPQEQGGAFPDEPLFTVASASGALQIEVRTAPQQPPGRGETDVELTILDAAGAARDDLSVSAVPWMPAMGHGSSTDPAVLPEGEGRYEVQHVEMFMPGEWELRAEITGTIEDSATIRFQIP